MKSIFGILSFTLLLIACVSCKKDKTNDPPDATVLTGDSILHQVKKNSTIIGEYVYNADHTVSTITSYNDDGSFGCSSSFIYNSSARVVKINNVYSNTAYNSYDTCYYNSNNQLTNLINFCNGVQDHNQAVQYDGSGRMIHFYYNYGGGMFGTNYIYGSNFNPLKEYDSGDLVCDTTYYNYDNKKNIKIKGCPGLIPDEFSENNIIQQIHNNQSGIAKPTDSYNSIFEYNSNNLPVKETRTYMNNTVVVYEYIYY